MIIISGGQTGADIAGLKVAKQLNFKTGGFAAKNFMTENGPNPKLAEYNLIDEGLSYRERTELNCKIAKLQTSHYCSHSIQILPAAKL